MKKTLLAVAVAAGAVILVSPKIIANKADAQLTQVVSSINELPGYNASIVNTEQSWFRSTTTLNLALDFAELDPSMADQSPEVMAMFEDLNIDVLIDMQHGPVLVDKGLGLSDIQIRVPNTSDDIKNGDQKVENFYLFDGELNLFGDLSYKDSFAALQLPFAEDEGEFVFSGYQGAGKTTNGVVNYSGSSSSVEINFPEFNLKMSDISANWEGEFDIVKLMKGMYGNSKSNIVIGDFEASQAAQSLFGWDDFEIYANTVVDEANLTDIQMGYRVTSLDTPIDKFEDIEIAFEFNNLDQEFIATYYELMLPMQNAQTDPQELLNSLKEPVTNLLSNKPEMKITNMGFKTAAGTLKSEATLKLAEYKIDETQLEDATFWQNNLLLDTALDLPKNLALDLIQKNIIIQLQADPAAAGYTPQQLQDMAAQQAQMTLDGLMQGGFLVEQDGQLQLAFNVANGTANLNGNEIPLEALMPAQ